MIRVGLVGLGGISKVHLDAYAVLDNLKLVAAADVRGEASPRYDLARELGATVYTSIDDMLANEELDMLDVCTPTPLHGAMVKEAMKRGMHVLSEKPMCRTAAECEEMVALSEENGGLYMVAHVVRFMKPYAYLRSVIRSGELGKLVHLSMKRLSHMPDWSHEDWLITPEKSGGAPLDLSIHDIDFVYSILGEPREVTGIYRTALDERGHIMNDVIISDLVYDGTAVNITGAFYNADIPFTAEYFAMFEGGRVELVGGKVYKCGEEVDLEAEEAGKGDTGINISGSGAYTEEIAYFASCIEAGKQPELVTPESSLGSVRLVERIVKAAKKA